MRKFGLLLGLVLLLCLPAAAQDHSKADVFLGYSYVRAKPSTSGAPSFNLNGGSGSIAFNPSSSFGVVADFGGYHLDETIGGTPVSGNLYTYLFGPRLYYRGPGLTPFVQALFGGARLTGGALGTTGSENAFAMTVGGGLDVNASRHVGIRLAQVEYLMTRFTEGTSRETQNNLRVSAGIVFRF